MRMRVFLWLCCFILFVGLYSMVFMGFPPLGAVGKTVLFGAVGGGLFLLIRRWCP
jgi:hypothetical protein